MTETCHARRGPSRRARSPKAKRRPAPRADAVQLTPKRPPGCGPAGIRVGSGAGPATTGTTAACMADGPGHNGVRQRGGDDRCLAADRADLRRRRQRPPSGDRARAAGAGGSRAAGSRAAAGRCDFRRCFDWLPKPPTDDSWTADHAGAQGGRTLGSVLERLSRTWRENKARKSSRP